MRRSSNAFWSKSGSDSDETQRIASSFLLNQCASIVRAAGVAKKERVALPADCLNTFGKGGEGRQG